MTSYQQTRDAMAREIFDLTRALTAFPPPNRFVELQIQLSDALEREADALGLVSRTHRAQPPDSHVATTGRAP